MDNSRDITEKTLIVDFGSQVTQLIARRLREFGAYCEIHPFHNVNANFLAQYDPKAIILSGGPASATDANRIEIEASIFNRGYPILGICYGQQVMCAQLQGRVVQADHREYGRAEIEVLHNHPLFDGIGETGSKLQVWMSHADRVEDLPKNFSVIAKTPNAPFAAITHIDKPMLGVQFHPEVIHTPAGGQMLENFIRKIAGLSCNWNMANFRDTAIIKIREQVGSAKVVCGLSGGVDSSVAALLIHQAIGDQLTCIYVDTGLMRHGESEEVVSLFRGAYNIPLIHIDAGKQFLKALDGVSDPERKRKIIGGLFIDVFEDRAQKIGGVEFLAQGTLYPDVIESVSPTGGPSQTIKSHHNVGGLPERMQLKLVEPLRELFKDEVRALGYELGLDEHFISRHPFPGPGLAIRIPGKITQEKVNLLQQVDAIYLDQIRKAGLYNEVWQAFAVLLPVNTVGVMGDNRTYEAVVALRAVTSSDGMTADYYPFAHDFLGKTANRIVNEVPGVNRVVYDITSKPPGTIEWE